MFRSKKLSNEKSPLWVHTQTGIKYYRSNKIKSIMANTSSYVRQKPKKSARFAVRTTGYSQASML